MAGPSFWITLPLVESRVIVPQITFQDIWLLRDPVAFDVKYQASAQPFLVLGMLVTALAVGHSPLTQVM